MNSRNSVKKILIFLTTFCVCKGIVPCKDSVQSKVCFLVDKIEDYVSTNNPEPFPTLVETFLSIIDVIRVDEDRQTVSVLMKMRLHWHDLRLDVNRTKEHTEKYFIKHFFETDRKKNTTYLLFF